jgi:hypothetical protein
MVFPISDGKNDHFDGRIFFGFILFTEALFFTSPT